MSEKKKSVVGSRQSVVGSKNGCLARGESTVDSRQSTVALIGLVLLLGGPGLARAQTDREPLTLRRAAERALARAPEIAVA